MHNVNDASDNEAVAARRRRLGQWIGEQIQDNDLDRTVLAAAVGVPVELVVAWEAGLAELTLDQAASLDHAFGLPSGSTGAAGGYFGFEAAPASPEALVSTKEYVGSAGVLGAVEAAMELGLGVRLRNQFVTTDSGPDWSEAEERWVLELSAGAPLAGDDVL